MISHKQWTEWGDVAEFVKDWAITAAAIIGLFVTVAPVCVITLLLLLSKIGNLT